MNNYDRKNHPRLRIVFMAVLIFLISMPFLNAGNLPVSADETEYKDSQINYYAGQCSSSLSKAYSEVLVLLQRIELMDNQQLDYKELIRHTDNAILSLGEGKKACSLSIRIANRAKDQSLQLKSLRIKDPAYVVKGVVVNDVIYKQFASYISNGDLAGYFKHLSRAFDQSRDTLVMIKKELRAGQVPDLKLFWSINELMSETTILNSYMTRALKSDNTITE